jgi:hypothetical protein
MEHSRTALAIDPDDQPATYHLILALRRTEDRNEIPALVRKLMELQRDSKSKASASSRFRLYEVQDDRDSKDR